MQNNNNNNMNYNGNNNYNYNNNSNMNNGMNNGYNNNNMNNRNNQNNTIDNIKEVSVKTFNKAKNFTQKTYGDIKKKIEQKKNSNNMNNNYNNNNMNNNMNYNGNNNYNNSNMNNGMNNGYNNNNMSNNMNNNYNHSSTNKVDIKKNYIYIVVVIIVCIILIISCGKKEKSSDDIIDNNEMNNNISDNTSNTNNEINTNNNNTTSNDTINNNGSHQSSPSFASEAKESSELAPLKMGEAGMVYLSSNAKSDNNGYASVYLRVVKKISNEEALAELRNINNKHEEGSIYRHEEKLDKFDWHGAIFEIDYRDYPTKSIGETMSNIPEFTVYKKSDDYKTPYSEAIKIHPTEPIYQGDVIQFKVIYQWYKGRTDDEIITIRIQPNKFDSPFIYFNIK